MTTLLNGKALADEILKNLTFQVKKLERKPGLAAILVGNDPASHLYVKLKKKAAEKCGMHMHIYLLEEDASEKAVLDVIDFLNHDEEIDGIIVQLPLPKKFHTNKIIAAIDPKKDVDGFHPKNLKALKDNRPKVISGVALGILELILSSKIPIHGKKAVIISNNPIFALPLEYLLKKHGVKPVAINARHRELKREIQSADIVIIARGKPRFLTASWIKKNTLIIDVGINRFSNGKVVGDVHSSVWEKTAFLSPVPGGVGPMTVVMLLKNTYKLAINKEKTIEKR
jgi:methylenetetrahydrofolate dehydrogenase (NADP+)/methenyltetrahydrofolate cyclohydrolase